MHRPGFTFAETLIVGSLFALFILVGTLVLSIERSRTRDAKRVADMTHVAAAFAVLHAQQASYAGAADGCGQVGVPVSTCALDDALPGLGTIEDPGNFSYIVTRVPDRDDFSISFELERSYDTLAAGKHTLTKDGFR